MFDANNTSVPNTDFGDSILRLDPSNGLTLTDWFTPDDQQTLADNDTDLGSEGWFCYPTKPPDRCCTFSLKWARKASCI